MMESEILVGSMTGHASDSGTGLQDKETSLSRECFRWIYTTRLPMRLSSNRLVT